jgi:hypothetical protein
LERFQPIFKYYCLNSREVVVEIDPQNGSAWPFHLLVYCLYNPDTAQWELYKNERVALNISKPDQNSAIREACYQLVKQQNEKDVGA